MKSGSNLVLHGYWRSGTSYRVRIALNLKGLCYESVPVNLFAGEQRSPDFLKLNPQGLVPALITPSGVLTQSAAIIEWLDEAFPDPPLLPDNADDRAIVRAMSLTVGCDMHPLHNARVLNYLADEIVADGGATSAWTAHWMGAGFEALDKMIGSHGGRFAFGDTLTMADCHLVPQIYSAERFSVDLMPYPNVRAVAQRAREVAAIAAAAPERQPDAPDPMQ